MLSHDRPAWLNAVGYIEVARTVEGGTRVMRGTAYLIGPNKALTCATVVQALLLTSESEPTSSGEKASRKGKKKGKRKKKSPHPRVDIRFPHGTERARVTELGENADVAVLELEEAVADVTPLALSSGAPPTMVNFTCAGFVDRQHKKEPTTFSGVLASTTGTDDLQQSFATLVSPELAGAAARENHALAGSPVVVAGEVVGHVRWAILKPDSLNDPLAGLTAAVPVDAMGLSVATGSESGSTRQSTESYHLFWSIRRADLARAEELKDELELAGFNSYLSSHEMVEGVELAPAERQAATGSRYRVLALSEAWLHGEPHLDSTKPVRAMGDVVVCRLDETPVPHEYSDYPFFDLSGPNGANEQAASALKDLLLIPSGETSNGALGEGSGEDRSSAAWKTVEAASKALNREIDSVSDDPEAVMELAESWQRAGMPGAAVPLLAARRLRDAGRPNLALAVMDRLPNSPRTARQKAITLSKADRNGDAIDLLERLVDKGQADARTIEALGGRYKQEWLDTGRHRWGWLRRSFDTYLRAYRDNARPSAGINAATLARLLGNEVECQALANQVWRSLPLDGQMDAWGNATLGEALLLKGDFEGALSSYGRAAVQAQGKRQQIATMKSQALLILRHRLASGEDQAVVRAKEELERRLRLPPVVGLVGPRSVAPPSTDDGIWYHEDLWLRRLRAQARAKLQELDPGAVLILMADEPDLVLAEQALSYGARLELILPYPLADIRQDFDVLGLAARFDRVVEPAEVVPLGTRRIPSHERTAGLGRAAQAVVDRTIERANTLGEDPHLVVFEVEALAKPGDATSSAVATWLASGLDPVEPVQIVGDGSAAGEAVQAPEQGEAPAKDDPPTDPLGEAQPTGDPPGEVQSPRHTESGTHRSVVVEETRSPEELAEEAARIRGRRKREETIRRLLDGNYNARHCLSIGIDLYQAMPRLRNAVSDAKGFAAQMRTFGFNVKRLLNEKATIQGMRAAVEDYFAKTVGEDDLFVLFFAGHGESDNGQGYLAPVDANPGTASHLIKMTTVAEWVRDLKARHVLFVLDCCFSGHAASGLGTGIPGEAHDARVVVTAGHAKQPVLDGGAADRHSVFSSALLEAFGDDSLRRSDGSLTLRRLFDRTEEAVLRATNPKQRPRLGKLPGDGGASIIFK